MTKEEKAAQEAAEVENMIKTVEKAKEAKKAEITGLVVLINNSKKVELTDEQVAGCKTAMVQICGKFVTGEKITADENIIMQYVASLTKKAVHAGQTEAEKVEAKIQAEKTFAADLQKYEIDLAAKFVDWSTNLVVANTIKNEADATLNFVKMSKDTVKVSFAEFIKSLPIEPKKPGTGKKSDSGEKSSTRIPNEPSVLSVVKGLIETNPTISKKELIDKLVSTFTARKESDVKASTNAALKALVHIFPIVAEEAAK